MFETTLEAPELAAITAEISATERQIKLAFNKAATSTTGWMRRMARTWLTQELKLRSGAVLKRRIIVRRRNNKGLSSFQFWVGVNDLRMEDFKGRAVQTETGVGIGDHFVEGGFFIRTKNGKRLIMRRSSDRHLPIERVTAPIEEQARTIIERVHKQANDFFVASYRRELLGMIARGYGA